MASPVMPSFPWALLQRVLEQAQVQVVLCLAVTAPGTMTVDSRRSHRELEPLRVGMPLKLSLWAFVYFR